MEKIKSFLKTTKGLVIISIVVSLSIGFFAGMEYKTYQVRKVVQETISPLYEEKFTESPNLSEVLEKGEVESQKMNIIERKVGDEIELATIKFKVNFVEEKQILSTKYGKPAVAKENAKFVIVDIDITNITNTDFTLYPDDAFRLIDNKERKFTTYENTIGSIDNYLNMRKLAPGIKENGVLVYEIPKEVTEYSLIIGKAGTNEIYKVLLTLIKTQIQSSVPTSPSSAPVQPSQVSVPKNWREVKVFSSTGTNTNMDQNTDSFVIKSEKWRVHWSFQDSSKFASIKGTFAVFVYKTNGVPHATLLNVSGSGKGISYAYGSGEFYFRVLTTGGVWNLVVEEYR